MNKQNNLPKYWVVKNTNNDDFKVVINYLRKTYNVNYKGSNSLAYYGYDGGTYEKGTDCFTDITCFKNNPTLLTLEEFKKAINMEDNKKIIGYKLKDQKYRKAALKIADVNSFLSLLEYDFKYESIRTERLRESEVLDLWFEPIYEEEVKTINMGSFNLTVKDKKVFHKNEDITQYVKDLVRMFANLPISIGGKACTIKQIVFQDNGCEKNNNTTLDDWLKVFDMIK